MPKPVLQALVLADNVYQDRSTGKCVICGTFTTIIVGMKQLAMPLGAQEPREQIVIPMQIGAPYVYLALVEVIGNVPLVLKYVNLSEDSAIVFEAHLVVAARDPVAVAEYFFRLPSLPQAVGNYCLDVLHNDELLGSWRVFVKDGNKKEEQEPEA